MRTPSPPPPSPPQVQCPSSSLAAATSSLDNPSPTPKISIRSSDSSIETSIGAEIDNSHFTLNFEPEKPYPEQSPLKRSDIRADSRLDFVIPTPNGSAGSNFTENLESASEIEELGVIADSSGRTADFEGLISKPITADSSGIAADFEDTTSKPVVESSNSKRTSFSLWNAVVTGPMRRLQEHLRGSRWGSAKAEVTKSSIWILGVCYSLCEEGSSEDVASTAAHTDFQIDYSSRVWFTYRKGFEALGPTKLTSDVNWGCMLRSGQMLLAQALVCHHLGRHWRRKPSEPNSREYLKILQCFGDSPSQHCPFSIHNIIEAGAAYGLVAGAWLGPYALCRSLEALAHQVRGRTGGNRLECDLPMKVYVVSGDGDGERGGAPCICMDDVESFATGVENTWAPILLLVPLVLGLDKVTSRYLPSLWATFTFPQSLGILGGKPGASTYLVGVQGDQAFYLDPHEVQQVLIVSPDDVDVDVSSYHCSVLKKMPLNAIDPSLALGFYCRDRGDFEDLCKRATDLEKDSNGAPMFTVVRSRNKGVGSRAETEQAVAWDELDEHEEDWQIL